MAKKNDAAEVTEKKPLTMPKTMTVEVEVPMGIQNTLEVVQFGVALAAAIKKAKADGKINIADVGLLLPVAPMIIPMIKDIDQVPKELGDLSQEELAVLLAAVAQELGSTSNDPKLIIKVTAALKFAHAGYDLYTAFAK